jgi:hypothetical protein
MILGTSFTKTLATKTQATDTYKCNQTCAEKLLISIDFLYFGMLSYFPMALPRISYAFLILWM